jgi:mannose-6-phosphate isomerase-like protein (cupin superfamily)
MNPLVHRREFILGTSMLIAGFAVRPQGARGEAQLNTMKLPEKPDYLAPDGSEIRLLVATPRGSMAHCQLPPNAVTKPVWHRSVEEIWYCVRGRGQLWRQYGSTESVTDLEPGVSVLIAFQERFQFRAFDQPLELILATIPGWPGADEAVGIDHGKWPTISD